MNNTALYIRISKDELNDDSINNQKEILTSYCKTNKIDNIKYYIDNGYTGTNLNRPALKRLLSDVAEGIITNIITKDLSRLGRNYIDIGYITDYYFKRHNITYTAINDIALSNIDNDFMIPIKNIFNEYYAKDISNKIRFTLNNYKINHIKRKTARPIYGYTIDGKIDDAVLSNIRLIYNLYLNGKSIRDIKDIIEAMHIINPQTYFNLKYNYKYRINNMYSWNISSISNILRYKEYKGTLVLNKTYKRFKAKNVNYNHEDKLILVDDKIPKLINENDYNNVKALRLKKNNNFKSNNIYKGLIYCSICNNKFRYKEDKKKDGTSFIRLTCRGNHKHDKPSILIDDLNKYIKYIEHKSNKINILNSVSKIFISKNLCKYKNKGCIRKYIKIEYKHDEIISIL